MKKESGVTLVSLVITVIVMVILAGVTLSSLTGEDGIITVAQAASQNMINASREEDALIQNLLNEIKDVGGGSGSGGDIEIPEIKISFGEIIWEGGKAKISIQSSEAGKKIEYQINGTSGEWKEIASGGSIENLQHGDTIYARLTDEEGSSGVITKKIEDKIAPRVRVEVGEITGTSIEVTVTATEEESGLAERETYQYYIGEAIMGRSTSNTFTYTELSEETDYTLRVVVTDKAGNAGEGTAEATTMQPEPTGWKFVTCLTANTEYQVSKNGTYRITCIGKSADGASGTIARRVDGPDDGGTVGDWTDTYYGGNGGNGGGSGGISRSILSLKDNEKIHCTIDTTISSFGEYLSATAASGVNPGTGTGGTEFNTTGNAGGTGGLGAYYRLKVGVPITIDRRAKNGNRGGGNGALPGTIDNSNSYPGGNGGGGGGGATYNLPSDIAYDDPLYTTYIVRDLSVYKGGNGYNNQTANSSANASTYPTFSADAPVWYGGGNGGGGGYARNSLLSPVGTGSAGSPGGILIEEAIYD